MQRQKQSDQEDQALAQLASTLVLPREWSNRSSDGMGKLQFCKISHASGSSSQPLRIIFSLTIDSHLSWSLYLYNHKLTPAMCNVLHSFPMTLDSESLNNLICTVDSLKICPGQPDQNFVSMIKAKKREDMFT